MSTNDSLDVNTEGRSDAQLFKLSKITPRWIGQRLGFTRRKSTFYINKPCRMPNEDSLDCYSNSRPIGSLYYNKSLSATNRSMVTGNCELMLKE